MSELEVTHEPTCNRCRYWDEVGKADEGDNYSQGLCRRYAPRSKLDDELSVLDACWPRTDSDDWCGEWQAVPDATPKTTVELKLKEVLRLAGMKDGRFEQAMFLKYALLLKDGYSHEQIVQMTRLRANSKAKRALLQLAADYVAKGGRL